MNLGSQGFNVCLSSQKSTKGNQASLVSLALGIPGIPRQSKLEDQSFPLFSPTHTFPASWDHLLSIQERTRFPKKATLSPGLQVWPLLVMVALDSVLSIMSLASLVLKRGSFFYEEQRGGDLCTQGIKPAQSFMQPLVIVAILS